LRESLRLADGIDDQIVQELALRQLAVAHHELGDYDRAMTEHRKALQISRELGHKAVEADVLFAMAETLRAQERS
jgi:tetratricopeptide (TPR) repeat protein